MAAHFIEPVKEVARKSGAFLAIIPVRLTKKLQPLDLSPNHNFKSTCEALGDMDGKWAARLH